MGYKRLKIGIVPKWFRKSRIFHVWKRKAYNPKGSSLAFWVWLRKDCKPKGDIVGLCTRFGPLWIQIQWGEI